MRRRSGRSRREQADLRPELDSIPCPLAEYATALRLVLHFGHDWWARVTRCVSGNLTSAAMLGVKLSQVMLIKVKADEERRLESEREALYADLGESLGPEDARRVISEHRRKSVLGSQRQLRIC